MKLLVELHIPTIWRHEYADVVKALLLDNDIDVASVEVLE
jgi:hypothetical protein